MTTATEDTSTPQGLVLTTSQINAMVDLLLSLPIEGPPEDDSP